jgi:hypothetical protein
MEREEKNDLTSSLFFLSVRLFALFFRFWVGFFFGTNVFGHASVKNETDA